MSGQFAPEYAYTRIAVTLALTSLLRKSIVEQTEAEDDFGKPYSIYSITDKGMSWLLHNQEKLILKYTPRGSRNKPDDEDVPF